MKVRHSIGMRALLALGVLAAGFAPALAYEQPRNTISIGIQGQYGLLGGANDPIPDDTAKGSWGSLFDYGEGIALRIRYSTARNRAVGLSFEDQRFRQKGEFNDSYPDQLQLTQVLGEYYMYFRRPKKVTQYVVVGAGFHRPAIRIQTTDVNNRELEETRFPGMSITIMAGVGMEYFFSRQASIDVSLRGYGVNSDPSRSGAGEIALGVHYYTK